MMPERRSRCIKKERERRFRAFPSDSNPVDLGLYSITIRFSMRAIEA